MYTSFLKKIINHAEEVEKIMDRLVEQIREILPDFGKHLAIDSKAISSYAKRPNKEQQADGRRDTDADYGKKEYKGKSKEGKMWEKVVKWFGYKLHLVVDATYELPIAYKATKASASDIKEGHALLEQMEKRQREILEEAETIAADKGYDDTKLIEKCWDQYKIKPVIDMRNMWKDEDETRLLRGKTNVAYNYNCYCPKTNTRREMVNGGFEEDRNTLKKLCPAKQ